MSNVYQDRDTITVRVPRKLRNEVDRLAKEKKVSRNQMCSELIDVGIGISKDMSNIRKALKECRGWFDELVIDKLAIKLKKEKLNLYQKAYLAYKLSIEQRTELFKKIGLTDELEEAYTIDTVLSKAKEKKKDDSGYNLYQVANNLNFKLSDFGQEYLSWYIGNDGIEKIKELKPDILPSPEVELEFDEEEEIEPEELLIPEEIIEPEEA